MGSFGISECNITGEKKKKMYLIATASREVAQMLVLATSEWGLDREARVARLG